MRSYRSACLKLRGMGAVTPANSMSGAGLLFSGAGLLLCSQAVQRCQVVNQRGLYGVGNVSTARATQLPSSDTDERMLLL